MGQVNCCEAQRGDHDLIMNFNVSIPTRRAWRQKTQWSLKFLGNSRNQSSKTHWSAIEDLRMEWTAITSPKIQWSPRPSTIDWKTCVFNSVTQMQSICTSPIFCKEVMRFMDTFDSEGQESFTQANGKYLFFYQEWSASWLWEELLPQRGDFWRELSRWCPSWVWKIHHGERWLLPGRSKIWESQRKWDLWVLEFCL